MTAKERTDIIESMLDNFDHQNEPKVGIFWYDERNDELLGVSKIEASEIQFNRNGLKTIKTLHKDWWKKQQMRAKAKGQYASIFIVDYTKIPRGRIFQKRSGDFMLMCGSWMTDHVEALVKDEFDLNDVVLERVIDEHWEIGHGWSEDYD